jgi:iron complex outermembrane receptor protein
VLVFSQIAKGFKSGGINLGAQTGPFDAETLLSYELGIKSSFLEQRGQLNATMFYSDFENYQLQSILGTALVITSGDADITGLELESRYLTSETVSIGLMASWNNSEITDYSGALINPATLALVQTGEPLPRTPESSYRVDIQKDFQLSSGRLISTGAAYTWQDDANLDPFGTFGADQSDYGLLDAYIRLSELDDRWSLDLFGKNLTDEFYKQSAFLSAAALGSAVNANIGERRTYGLRFRAQY